MWPGLQEAQHRLKLPPGPVCCNWLIGRQPAHRQLYEDAAGSAQSGQCVDGSNRLPSSMCRARRRAARRRSSAPTWRSSSTSCWWTWWVARLLSIFSFCFGLGACSYASGLEWRRVVCIRRWVGAARAERMRISAPLWLLPCPCAVGDAGAGQRGAGAAGPGGWGGHWRRQLSGSPAACRTGQPAARAMPQRREHATGDETSLV